MKRKKVRKINLKELENDLKKIFGLGASNPSGSSSSSSIKNNPGIVTLPNNTMPTIDSAKITRVSSCWGCQFGGREPFKRF